MDPSSQSPPDARQVGPEALLHERAASIRAVVEGERNRFSECLSALERLARALETPFAVVVAADVPYGLVHHYDDPLRRVKRLSFEADLLMRDFRIGFEREVEGVGNDPRFDEERNLFATAIPQRGEEFVEPQVHGYSSILAGSFPGIASLLARRSSIWRLTLS